MAKRWSVWQESLNTIHVVPRHDERKHLAGFHCHCEPKVQFVEGGYIVVHKSYDFREALEWIKAGMPGLLEEV